MPLRLVQHAGGVNNACRVYDLPGRLIQPTKRIRYEPVRAVSGRPVVVGGCRCLLFAQLVERARVYKVHTLRCKHDVNHSRRNGGRRLRPVRRGCLQQPRRRRVLPTRRVCCSGRGLVLAVPRGLGFISARRDGALGVRAVPRGLLGRAGLVRVRAVRSRQRLGATRRDKRIRVCAVSAQLFFERLRQGRLHAVPRCAASAARLGGVLCQGLIC